MSTVWGRYFVHWCDGQVSAYIWPYKHKISKEMCRELSQAKLRVLHPNSLTHRLWISCCSKPGALNKIFHICLICTMDLGSTSLCFLSLIYTNHSAGSAATLPRDCVLGSWCSCQQSDSFWDLRSDDTAHTEEALRLCVSCSISPTSLKAYP